MNFVFRGLLAASFALIANAAWATFHTFQIQQIFSNADGSIQYVVLHESIGFDGQNFLVGHSLFATPAMAMTQQFPFPSDLPSSSTAGKHVLIATQGFASLGIVTPDYIIPNGFIPLSGTINYAQVDQVTYSGLPTDGVHAIDRTGASIANLATNFAGQSAAVGPVASANYQGLWWAAPANSESGWGINFAHQGDTIFASWFTYDLTGKGMWLVMTAPKSAPNTYTGALYSTSGVPFNTVPYPPNADVPTQVGTGTLAFTDVNDGSFAYTVNGIMQNKSITRQAFGTLPTCVTTTGSLAAATNYTDLWWASPAGSEAGWGINLNHESDTIFAAWFTYDLNGSQMWLVATAPKTSPGVYAGALYRTTGLPFNTVPYLPNADVATQVGTATFTFSDGNNATFAYTVNGIAQMKAITREVFNPPGTVCQ